VCSVLLQPRLSPESIHGVWRAVVIGALPTRLVVEVSSTTSQVECSSRVTLSQQELTRQSGRLVGLARLSTPSVDPIGCVNLPCRALYDHTKTRETILPLQAALKRIHAHHHHHHHRERCNARMSFLHLEFCKADSVPYSYTVSTPISHLSHVRIIIRRVGCST
jgi:hypothetical protein